MFLLFRDHLEQLRDSKIQAEQRCLTCMREVDEQRAVVSALREENARLISEAEEGQREKKGYVERIEQLEGKVKSLKTECKRLEEERDRMVLEADRNEEQFRELEKRLENEKMISEGQAAELKQLNAEKLLRAQHHIVEASESDT